MAKKKAKKNGRPTRYRPNLCNKLIEHFDIEPWEERKIPHYTKSGEKDKKGESIIVWTDIKILPVRMPTLRGFAKKMNIAVMTLYNWINPEHASYHKDFLCAFTCAKDIRKDWLIDLGLSGIAPPASFKFVAVNVTEMRDKSDVNLSGEVILKPPKIA